MKGFYTELGETSNAQLICSVAFGGKTYINTDDALPNMRGLSMIGDGSDHKQGKKTYMATEAAFNKLKATYSFSFSLTL